MKRLHAVFIALTASTLASCSSTPHRETVALPKPVQAPIVQPDPDQALLARMQQLAPAADPGVLALAVEARACAVASGEVAPETRLAVIDYSRPSTDKRLWVFDVANDRLLYNEHVSHGQGSGGNYANRFSNVEGSYATSLGLYRTAETYIGSNGYSMRMDGLDAGFNDNARMRAIVMHGAWYANPDLIRSQGRLGRSQGCPALREGIAREVIDTLKGRQLLFSYADDAQWLSRSRHFACRGKNARQIIADARNLRAGSLPVVAVAAP